MFYTLWLRLKKKCSSSVLWCCTGEACSEGETWGFFPRRTPTCTRNSWVQHALVTALVQGAAHRGWCGGSKPAPQPLAAGEAWQWELQMLLWHLQPINRTRLHAFPYGKENIHIVFAVFLSCDKRRERAGIGTQQWSPYLRLCHSPGQGKEGVSALSHCLGLLFPAWRTAGLVALGLITVPGIVLPFSWEIAWD